MLGTVIFSQETETAGFTPFVTELQGEVKNNLLRLTWVDSPDAKGPVYIFRSPAEFDENAESIPGRPAAVPYGMETYMDEIDDSGTYYYFAAASDEEGQYYYLYIRPDNTISIQITGSIGSPEISSPTETAEQTGTPDTGISAIRVRPEEDSIRISFRAGADSNPVLYRSVRPIRVIGDLFGAVIIQRNAESPFYDFPVPGIPYYYALVPESELTRGTVSILPGINTTIEPIEVSPEKTGILDARTVPLPRISLSTAVSGISYFEETPRPAELDSKAESVLGDVPVYQKDPVPPKDSIIFPQDLETTGGGEEYLLSAIIQGSFYNREWETAREELTRFISLPRSRAAEARARFYLGQCLYFTHFLKEALFEFLSARSVYPQAAAEWIQAILQRLTEL